VAHVCDDIACKVKGADRLCAEMETMHGPEGSGLERNTTWHRSPCLGLCERAPAALVLVAGERHYEQALAPATAEQITSALQGDEASSTASSASIPQMGQPGLTLLRRVGQINRRASTNISLPAVLWLCVTPSKWGLPRSFAR
jgi:NADH-quinone oxidoreductase subunit F